MTTVFFKEPMTLNRGFEANTEVQQGTSVSYDEHHFKDSLNDGIENHT
jgi:hypothetical protein